jgi:phage shock protein E
MNLQSRSRVLRSGVLVGILAPLLLVIAGSAWAAEAYWIDVRSAEEYAADHLSGALNIPHTEIAERIGEVTTDKDAPIYLYCRSGRRSGLAQAALQQAGYTEVTNLGALRDARATAARLEACAINPSADC